MRSSRQTRFDRTGWSVLARIEQAPAPPPAEEQGFRPVTYGAVAAGEAAGLASGDEQVDPPPWRGSPPFTTARASFTASGLCGIVHTAASPRVPPRRHSRTDVDEMGLRRFA